MNKDYYLTDEEKARGIFPNHTIDADINKQDVVNALLEMAKWKDQQWKKRVTDYLLELKHQIQKSNSPKEEKTYKYELLSVIKNQFLMNKWISIKF